MTDEQASNFVEDSRQSRRRDAETITDICYRDSGSEIHMVSLLEERIPRYTLRSDALTNFAGFDNEDFTIGNPCFRGEFDPDLSADLIEETLKYFIMGGARISQITKTFDDSRALTLLLEEKERDLEISAELGKILVNRVRSLEKTIFRRTQENEKLKAQISNLQRELTMRDSLLRVHVEDFDSDAEPENDDEKCITGCSSLKLTSVHVESLRKRVKTLQTENDQMASSVQRIATEMADGQDREDSLVTTCIDNLLQMNYSILFLREELDAKMELIARQQEEICSYSEQMLVVEAKAKKVSGELRRVSKRLSEAETQQQTAIAEIEGWKERYTECWNLLEAANDELKSLRKAQSKTASVIHRNYSSSSSLSPFLPMGSLASELHDSQRKDLFFHLGYTPSATKQHSRRVMDVAKAVARISARRCLVASEDQIYTGGGSGGGGGGTDDGGSGGGDSTTTADEDDGISNGDSLESQCGSPEHAGSDDDISDSELNDTDRSDWSQRQKVLSDFNHLSLGQPGIPGSNDLEVALMRLNSPTMFSSPIVAPKNCHSLPDDTQSKESLSPLPAHLSIEARSRNSSVTNLSEANSFTFAKPKIPEKLQIIKPIEGSLTLNHWKSLGIPNLQGLLESRPGVQTKDQPPVQLFEDAGEMFSLSDYEEDSTPASNCRADDRTETAADKTFDENSRFWNAKNAEKLSAENADGRLRYIDDCQTTMMTLPDIVTSEKRTSHSKETTAAATTTSKRIQSCAFM